MKHIIKTISLAGFLALCFAACDNSDYKNTSNKEEDTSHNTVPIPAPDNSSATNPSLADTAFSKNKDTTVSSTIDTANTKPTSSKGKGKKGKVELAMSNNKDESKIEMDKEGVYNRAEIMPSFPGGEKALASYIENNIQYPEAAIDNGTEGTVILTFAVDELGKVYAPKLASQKIGDGLEEEAMRVVGKMPKWNPGRIKGKNVKTKFTLPIHFVLA